MRVLALLLPLALQGCLITTMNYQKPDTREDGSLITGALRCELELTHLNTYTYESVSIITDIPCGGPYDVQVVEGYIVVYRQRSMENAGIRPCEGFSTVIEGDVYCVGKWSDYVVTYNEPEI